MAAAAEAAAEAAAAAAAVAAAAAAAAMASALRSFQETEQTVRQRTQRESEILISNLGVQHEIERRALITDMQHARAIACAHESLQWFCAQMRALIDAIPPHAQTHLKRAVEITSPDGTKVEQVRRACGRKQDDFRAAGTARRSRVASRDPRIDRRNVSADVAP